MQVTEGCLTVGVEMEAQRLNGASVSMERSLLGASVGLVCETKTYKRERIYTVSSKPIIYKNKFVRV